METSPIITISQRTPIGSLSLDKGELRTLLDRLQERCSAAGKLEAAAYSPMDMPPEQLTANRKKIEDGFQLFVTVTGVDGNQVNGSILTIFASPNFPEDVRDVVFDSGLPLKNQNYWIGNRCALFLDFTRPGIFNFSLLPSLETPNASNFEVHGNDATWVNGVFHEVAAFVRDRPSTVQWLHRHSIYDVLLWLVGFPLGFWATHRLSGLIGRFTSSEFVRAGAYLYAFMAVLFAFRVLFHYARWIWPMVEYRCERSRSGRHKALWGILAGGVFVDFLWDVIKALWAG